MRGWGCGGRTTTVSEMYVHLKRNAPLVNKKLKEIWGAVYFQAIKKSRENEKCKSFKGLKQASSKLLFQKKLFSENANS